MIAGHVRQMASFSIFVTFEGFYLYSQRLIAPFRRLPCMVGSVRYIGWARVISPVLLQAICLFCFPYIHVQIHVCAVNQTLLR